MPRELRDPAFDRYVDLALLGTAWADVDASLMTDVALQLIEGERVLARPHRVINTDELLRISIRMAAVKRDAATLSRLESAIKPRGSAALLAQLSEAQKELAEAKPEEPVRTVSVDAISAEAFAFYKGCLNDIDAALVANDAAALAQLEKELAGLNILPAECQAKLQDKIAASKGRLTSPEQPIARVAGILDKLAGATRNPEGQPLPEGSGWLDENPTVPGGGEEEEGEEQGTPGGGGDWGGGGWGGGEWGGGGWEGRQPYRPNWRPSYSQQQQQWIPPRPPTRGKYPPPGKYTPPSKYPRRYWSQ
jgi:hypothetical protein